MDGRRPRALVVTVVHWASTARQCLALVRSGCEVAVVAPADHGLHRLHAMARHFVCDPHADVTSAVARAISAWSPDIVIPADDPSLRCLHEIHALASCGRIANAAEVEALIVDSLGDAEGFAIAEKRSELIRLAAAEGIAVPPTAVIRDGEDLRERLRGATFPQVLKADGSWSGLGVRIVQNGDEAMRAYRRLLAQSGWFPAVKRAIKGLSAAPLLRRAAAGIPAITLQDYVRGLPANRAVVCAEGEVLAGLSVEALQTVDVTGAATVVRVVDNGEMAAAVARIVKRLRLSGFVGCDFVVEAATGRAHLIEMNARPTPICHLALDRDSDMMGALVARLSGVPRRQLAPADERQVIALHPQELWRDPQSPFLGTANHDVPWDEPEFISAFASPVPPDPANWTDGPLRRLRLLRAGGARLLSRGGAITPPAPLAPGPSTADKAR